MKSGRKGESKVRRKVTIGMIAAAFLIMMANTPVLANWEQANGTWSYKENGQNITNTWKQINGKWYYFNEAGFMQSGWLEKNGKWYYLDPNNGDMKEGWVQDNGKWYYLNNTSGEMATGWLQTGDTWYFLDNSGSMQTGIIEVNGKIYALDKTSGAMQTGTVLWQDQSVNVYTFDPVTGEAIGSKIPIPDKAYSSDGQQQADFSAAVKEQIWQMQEKQREEAQSNYNNSNILWDDSDDSDDSDDYENNIVTNVKIQEITVPASNRIDVVLSQATSLNISNFYISCPAGKDMTILQVETETGSQKNKVYHLTTAYFNDNTYNMEITLSNGKKIEKTFVTSLASPELKEIETKRVDKNTANISFISDSAGILYYMAVPTNTSRQVLFGQAIGTQIPQTGQDVQKQGASMQLEQEGLHSLTINGLQENQAYTIYFATAQEEGETAVLRSSAIISAQPVAGDSGENTGNIEILEADAVSDSKIKLVFDKPTQETLTLADINVECVNGDIRIGNIQTEDNKTYYILMQANWFMNSKTGYTVYVTLPDGSQLNKKFYTDFDYPFLTDKLVRRTAEDEIEVTFHSNEGGVFYYGTSEYTDTNDLPTADEIVETGQKATLSGGANRLTVKINANDKLFYLIPVDLKGNRPPRFPETIEIPTEIEEDPDSGAEKVTDIEDITYSIGNIGGYHKLTVTLTNAIDVLAIENENIKVYPLDNQLLATDPRVVGKGETWDGPNIFYIDFNITFPSGRYELEFMYDGVYYRKEFEIK